MRTLEESFVILASIVMTFLVISTPLFEIAPQILALLVITSLIFLFIKKRANNPTFTASSFEVFSLTSGIFITVLLTGGMHSQIFFLVYFLPFAVAFLFNPKLVFVLLAGELALFLLSSPANPNVPSLAALVLLTPLAYFFGNEYLKRYKIQKDIAEESERIAEDADRLLHMERAVVEEEEVEIIDDILVESEKLKADAN